MSRDESIVSKTPEELRSELKAWESAFAKTNGRKAGREDIKKDAAIAAKYREYDNLHKRPAKTQTTARKNTKSTPRKADPKVLKERSGNAIAATPSKGNREGKSLQPSELSAVQEEEPTPACVRFALGPTPQKDGAVLGIFDMLSAGTPSKVDARTSNLIPEAIVAGTPTKPRGQASSDPQISRTPQSSGKRYYLDAFAGTPLKRKREDSDYTPRTSKKLFSTPSFLRRNWPLSRIDEDSQEPATAAGPPFRKRGLVRSLSTIIQGLKKQEEQRMDDEWDIMNELEAEEHGETDSTKPAAPPKVLVEDSQAAEMPLGPDQGDESSEDEGERDPGALDANGNPRKVWKKKGLKRQTRRVIMRPVLQRAKTAPGALLQGEEASEEVVEETQLPESAPRRGEKGDDDDFINDGDASDAGSKHDSQHSRHESTAKQRAKSKAKPTKQAEEKERKTKKVKPEAHANFRKLKIKNKNSKANGRGGRFGRR